MDTLEELQKKFINLRLGTFIHFSSGTIQFNSGEVEDWEFDHENGGKPRLYPFDEKDWNPDRLDCDQWAAAAKSGGMRFAAYTSKHHEGFAMWPTAYSEHSVRNAANKTDVVAEYLRAFRKAGIVAGLYFSVLDITAGINRNSCTEEQKKMIRGQLTELLTNYGEIPFLILDGWNAPWGGPSYEMLPFEEIDSLVKSIQPDCLVMNIGWTKDIDGTDIMFFENGAGQEIHPGFKGPGALCQKLTGTWFWREEDTMKEPVCAEWAAEKMKECFASNVNFILNLTPNKDGRIDDNLVEEFRKLGGLIDLPKPLEEIPDGWLRRRK